MNFLHRRITSISSNDAVPFALSLGTPPDCELCHSPCYDNWQDYINTESRDIEALHQNVTALLSKFGGMTSQQIEEELAILNGNLSYVMNVFQGARYNTSAKELQFKQVTVKKISRRSLKRLVC